MPNPTFPPEEVSAVIAQIATILRERNQTISVSEAACGGLISSYLVAVPGASSYYQGGTLVYSLKSRLKLSGWSEEDINNYTGPSEDVALRLARNLQIELGSTYALSETGWAGPTGGPTTGQDGQDHAYSSPGTVFFGIAGPKSELSVCKHTGHSDRADNMAQFALLGLTTLLEYLQNN
ncbi:hypothetical protein NADFUDRAFT_84126 [Nadsonia fulvescens var. elongata DSM 6958]|uniref:CinA C-terminal domain-containing protein n=1 Tax=Nadsonia fulvescens var. elongata DSM 6958 TaxID=857566 RepID=A0A1E3PFE8_9ASCO|nr:hypothetical protein NADFUDRAFT_84126 [Nadsonia fulvescens var. elongata DSM 6958]